MPGLPLPPMPERFNPQDPPYGAYQSARQMESRAVDGLAHDPWFLVKARTLGYLVLHAPTEEGRIMVSLEISSCDNVDSKLKALADMYLQLFIRCFRGMGKGRTPAPASHPSRPSFDDKRKEFFVELKMAPTSHAEAKASALARDNYRSIILGGVDSSSLTTGLTTAAPNEIKRPTQLAHIIPDFINHGHDSQPHKKNYAAGVYAVLSRFGGLTVGANTLNGAGIHLLGNVMTLSGDEHTLFDALRWWLEPVLNTEGRAVPNHYHVKGTGNLGFPETIELTSHRNGFVLPDPRFLAIHAACAKVAWLSGGGEYIERHLRDMDETPVMKTDGTSFGLLQGALAGLAV